jgi:hypothetical protein
MTLLLQVIAACALTLGQDAPDQPGMAPGGDARAEAQALVERIKETLGQIDDALFEVPDADDIGRALDEVAAAHEQAVRDLEELIKQAKYRQGQPNSSGGGGGGGGGSDSPPQGNPPPRPSDGSQNQDQQQDGGGSPEEQEQSENQQGDGEEPTDGLPQGSDPGMDRAGGDPPPDPLSDPTRSDTDGRWGLLPPKVQERLMNLHIDDVPARYRDWLGAYVRALSAVEQEEGGR